MANGLTRFINRIGALKRVPRTGWLDRGVPPIDTESVADHSFRVALLAWLAAMESPNLDANRVLKLALIHDLPESVIGDLTPYDQREIANVAGADRADVLNRRHVRSPERSAAKRAAESAAMFDLVADLTPLIASELSGLWRELEEGSSPEARFVKQVDKLETYLQSREYLNEMPHLPMQSFATEVTEVIDHPTLTELLEAVDAVIEQEPV